MRGKRPRRTRQNPSDEPTNVQSAAPTAECWWRASSLETAGFAGSDPQLDDPDER